MLGTTTHKANRLRMQAASYMSQPWRSREIALSPEAEVLGCVVPRKAYQLLMLAEAADCGTWLAFHTRHDVFSLNS